MEGSPADWEQIERDFEQFAQYDLEWWVADLKPVLQQFTQASKGKVSKEFWQTIYDESYTSNGCTADVIVHGDAGEYKIDFWAGFVGITQDKATKALRPEINWSIVDSGRKPTREEMRQLGKTIWN